MKKIYRIILFFLFVFTGLFSLTPVYAATGINKQINFQGKLTNADGTNVADNTYSVVFTLSDASSGGNTLWTETQSVTTSAGAFQVALGSITSLSGVNFNADTIYLGIKVGADAEMTPRIRFAAVPYALNADKLNGVTATQSATGFTLSGGTSTSKTLTVSENLTLGSTITPTNAGALTIQSNGANGLTLDAGGSAALSIGLNNANAVNISKAGTATTINGGLTVASGQNLIFNSDTFTDLTGNGLSVSSNALGINLTSSGTTGLTSSNSGLEVSSSGLTLLKGCTDGQLLEYTDAGGWACANDDLGGGGSGSSNWTLGNGVIRPNNNTVDLFLGGIATASAKFGFLNVNSGTPTASISANSGNNATTLSGLGVLGTTNAQTLTLGSTSTGNVSLSPGGTAALTAIASGNIGIGGAVNSSYKLTLSNAGTGLALFQSTGANNATVHINNNAGGNQSSLVLEDAGVSKWELGKQSNNSFYLYDSVNAKDTLEIATNGDLLLQPASGKVGVGATLPDTKLTVVKDSTALGTGTIGNYGFNVGEAGGGLALGDFGTYKAIQSFSNTPLILNPAASAVGVGNLTAPQATFDVRGNSGITPVASVSGQTSFASMVVNNSGSGDIFTASSAGTTRFRIANNGSVLYQGDTLAAMGSGGTTTNSSAITNMIGDQGSMIPNSGFESNQSGITFADGWTVAASQSASVTRDTVDQAKGTASVKILTSNNSTAIYSACIPLAVKLTTYNLAWYAKANNTARIPTVRGYVDAYTSKANCQSNTSPSFSAALGASFAVNTSWQSFTGTTATAAFTANSTWARVHFFVANGSVSSTQVNIDGVRLVQSSLTQGVDYAENYQADPEQIAQPGEVVSLHASASGAVVQPAHKFMDQSMIGVVSTQPGQVLDDDNIPDPKVPVALAGRVPVNVSTKNGAIQMGDYLTSSDIPGVAVKATKAGPVLGTAMEDYTETDPNRIGSVLMFIKNTYYGGTAPDTGLTISQGKDSSGILAVLAASQPLLEQGTARTGKLTTPHTQLTSLTASSSGTPIASESATEELLGIATVSRLSVTDSATISANLRVQGNGLIEGMLNVIDTLTAQNLIVSRVADFFGAVIFHNDVSFQGRPTFNNDTAGFAVIKKGTNRIAVTFEKEYAQAPVVSANINVEQVKEEQKETMEAMEASLLARDVHYVVSRTTPKGFMIMLNAPAKEDIRFSWSALAIEKPETFDNSTSSKLMISPSVLGSDSAERHEEGGEGR